MEGGFFLLWQPPKSTNKLVLARLGVSRPIYLNVESPLGQNLGFSDRYFLGGAPVKKLPCIFQRTVTQEYISVCDNLHIIFRFIEKCYTRIKFCLPLSGVSFFKRCIFLRSSPHHPNDGGRFRHLIQCSWENDINYYNQDKCPD